MVKSHTMEKHTRSSDMEKYNNHHILFTRKAYQRTYDPYLLRNHPAMQVEIPVVDHNDLHANIPPLQVISTGLARYALSSLEKMPKRLSKFERFNRLHDNFEYLSRSIGEYALEAGMFNEQFDAQVKYFERLRA